MKALIVLMAFASVAFAGPFGRRGIVVQSCQGGSCSAAPAAFVPVVTEPAPSPKVTVTTTKTTEVKIEGDALDEVNALRAARGLRPFLRDEGLVAAARACAAHRAERRLFGHTSNDFSFLPHGSSASAAGCAAYHASYGWMSCCTYDSYTYAGAAYVTGADGKRYMHLFVR